MIKNKRHSVGGAFKSFHNTGLRQGTFIRSNSLYNYLGRNKKEKEFLLDDKLIEIKFRKPNRHLFAERCFDDEPFFRSRKTSGWKSRKRLHQFERNNFRAK